MIILIDNYDSFSYNLYQLIGSVEPDIRVIRNDDCTVEEIEAMNPEAIILSPGPGKPKDAGICIEAIRYFKGKVPIFGVCLGHQAICEAFGATVGYAKELMHGKKKEIEKNKAEQEEVVKLQKEKLAEQQEIVNEKKALVASYQNDLSKYEQMVAANEKADKAVLNQIAKQQQQSKSSGGSSKVYYTGNGSLGWPVPGRTTVSSGFVTRTSPITGRTESHSGLDIPAPYGTAIVAAEAGKVTYSGWMNGYGNTIIIDHGGGLSTLYGHNSSLVARVGQVVSRGQTVAKCGSTGWSTGNHCHFSVLKNGAYVNPRNYL